VAPLYLALFALLGTGAGLLIGCVGIGGIIVVPVLAYVAGVPLPTAITAAMCAFLVAGAVGLYVFAAGYAAKLSVDHSVFSVSTGSMLAARRAGT
jgi:uncharacterized membrane protein YfcA